MKRSRLSFRRKRNSVRPSAGARVKANILKGAKVAEDLLLLLNARGAGNVLRAWTQLEYRFHPVRKWRFDIAWPELKLAVEIEGGAWVAGAHTRGAHFKGDCEKYNTATSMGWRVLRVMPEHVRSGEATDWVIQTAVQIKERFPEEG